MLFYRVDVRCETLMETSEQTVSAVNRIAGSLHSTYKGKYYLFPLYSSGALLTMAAACELELLRRVGLKKLVGAFFEECGLDCEFQTPSEIRASAFQSLLESRRDSQWHVYEHTLADNYVEFQDALNEAMEAEENQPRRFKLSSIRAWNEQRVISQLNALPGYGMWLQECQNLSAKTEMATDVEFVHPCHYLCVLPKGDDGSAALNALLASLHQSKRVLRNTYCWWDCDDADDMMFLNEAYPLLDGGAMVIGRPSFLLGCRSRWSPELDMDDWDESTARSISRLCNLWRNRVLTIFLLDGEEPAFIQRFQKDVLHLLPMRKLEPVAMDDTQLDAVIHSSSLSHGIVFDDVRVHPLRQWLAAHPNNDAQQVKLWIDGYFDQVQIERHWPQYGQDAHAWLATLLPTPVAAPANNAIEELHQLIGLDNVKHLVRQASDFFLVQKQKRELGLQTPSPCMHMAFYGNPGTAKTTVARLIGQIFRQHGLLKNGELYEVGRADLVGKYIGWTAPTVKTKIKKAEGSVLFIDEAYSLLDDKRGLYGDEAINTLVQEMENVREHTVIILAGYPDPLRQMIASNPGLQGRIAFHVDFPNYSIDELLQILALKAQQQGLVITDGVLQGLHPYLEQIRHLPDFANGRVIRNLLEQALMAQASRLRRVGEVSREDYAQLLWEDFHGAAEGFISKEDHKVIGFN